jgi:hypothetical protein
MANKIAPPLMAKALRLMMRRLGKGQPQAIEDVLMSRAEILQAKRGTNLPHDGQGGGADQEAGDDRLGDVAGQVAQPQHRDGDLDNPDHGSEQEHGLVGVQPRLGIDEG